MPIILCIYIKNRGNRVIIVQTVLNIELNYLFNYKEKNVYHKINFFIKMSYRLQYLRSYILKKILNVPYYFSNLTLYTELPSSFRLWPGCFTLQLLPSIHPSIHSIHINAFQSTYSKSFFPTNTWSPPKGWPGKRRQED